MFFFIVTIHPELFPVARSHNATSRRCSGGILVGCCTTFTDSFDVEEHRLLSKLLVLFLKV